MARESTPSYSQLNTSHVHRSQRQLTSNSMCCNQNDFCFQRCAMELRSAMTRAMRRTAVSVAFLRFAFCVDRVSTLDKKLHSHLHECNSTTFNQQGGDF